MCEALVKNRWSRWKTTNDIKNIQHLLHESLNPQLSLQIKDEDL